MKKLRGFTLIELLIVIVIMGILAAIVVGLVATNSKNRANDVTAKANMRETQTALEQYMVDNGSYPTGNYAGLSTTLVPQYMAAMPAVPQGSPNNYVYTPGNQTPPTSYTLTYQLQNSSDNGPNVTKSNGVATYTLTSKQ